MTGVLRTSSSSVRSSEPEASPLARTLEGWSMTYLEICPRRFSEHANWLIPGRLMVGSLTYQMDLFV